jgi:nitrogen fixation NifU-like protein
MSLSDELYRETILDHYHNPRNQGTLDAASVEVEGVNPSCGDELTLFLNLGDDGSSIKDIKIKSRGCSINTASGSMMTELMAGLPLDKAEELVAVFKSMMLNKDEQISLPEEMEDLEALQGVKQYPVRIKCALLPWNTMLQGLSNAREGKLGKVDDAVTTE